VRYTRDATESKALNSQHGPMVVIAASGMAEAGRILHHLAHGASDPRNTILIVGFQAEHTLGRRIVDHAPMLRVFGDEIPLRARVEVLAGYSAHGDRHELQQWLDAVRDGGAQGSGDRRADAPDVYLVHGEPDAQDAFAEQLRAAGYPSVEAPVPHRKIVL
jgi:metallo-beta-lactamase family protein